MKSILYAAIVVLLTSLPALAQDAPAVRDFSSDRPGKANSPFTVPSGLFQVETDFLSYSQGFAGNSRTFQTTDPTVKYGLTNNIDVEIAFGGHINQWSRSTNGSTVRLSGFGDLTMGLKGNVIGNDGGAVVVAVLPYVKIPTATNNVGNGQMEYGLNIPVLFNLPAQFTMTLQPQVQLLKNANNNGKQTSFSGIANVGHPIYGDLSGFVEIYGQTNTDQYTKPMYTVDTGVAYLLTATTQIDTAVNIGLNKAAPAFVVYAGLSHRF